MARSKTRTSEHSLVVSASEPTSGKISQTPQTRARREATWATVVPSGERLRGAEQPDHSSEIVGP